MIRRIILTAVGILVAAVVLDCLGQSKVDKSNRFKGLYFGFDIGSQSFFSGALIDNVDVLAQQNNAVIDMKIGYRILLAKRVLFGATLGMGLTNGDLFRQYDNGRQTIDIEYLNKNQKLIGLDLGASIGSRRSWYVGLYALHTERTFEIQFTEENGMWHNQTDKNIFLRYGLHIEKALKDKVSLRFGLGSLYVDFGGVNTSSKPTNHLDTSIGLSYNIL